MFPHRFVANRRLVVVLFLVGLLLLGAQVEKPWPRATAQSFAAAGPAPLPNTFGDQNTLVMLVNFYDNNSQPYTTGQVNSMIFGTVNKFFYENSYQQVWLTGDVYGWFTIPMSSAVCDTPTLNNYANAAAAAAGANLSAYGRYVYIFPKNACTYAGSTSTGSSFVPMVDINGNLNSQVIAHELGHSFGLYHSSSMDCGSVSIGTNCTMDEYGDHFDDMSKYGLYHFNAYHKERLGWIGQGASSTITTVQSSGTYFIEPLETLPAGGPKALKILKSVDPVTGDKTWYYVEFRQPVGFDAPLLNYSNVMNGVLIHYGTLFANDFNIFNSYLLDMTPETSSWLDPALPVGRSFQDTSAGFTITPTGCSFAGCSVLVNFSSGSCASANPTVTLSPSQPAAVLPGSPVTYTVSVTNNDSASCSGAAFNLQANVPAGWGATFGSPWLSIAPGATMSTTLTVISPLSAAAGSYSVGITAFNSTASTYSGTAYAFYSVAPPSPITLSVSVSTDRSSYTINQTVTTRGSVLGNGAPVVGANVTFTVTKSNGSVTTMSATTGTDGSATVRYRLNRKDPPGTYQDKAAANMNGGSGSGITSFVVN